jgi:hypothetical protein
MNKEQQDLLDKVYDNYRNKKGSYIYEGPDGIPTIYTPLYINGEPQLLTKEGFINNCKTDPEFSEKWGLTIEERELSLEERYDLCAARKSKMTAISEEDYIKYNIPTKLITLTYNDQTIETYE